MPKLFLSRNKGSEVCVGHRDVSQLKEYHFHGIRSIYGTYIRQFKGTVLNYKYIEPAIVVYTFLSAMKDANEIKHPILVICSQKNICDWCYYMNKLSTVKVLSSNSNRSIFDSSNSVILCTIENLNLLKSFTSLDWSFVVIDDIDLVASKIIVKQVSGNFNIALTTKDFLGQDKDYKTQWHILNWSNPKLFGKIKDFEDYDRLHYANLRNPYDDIWHDMDLNIDDDMLGRVEDDQKEYERLVEHWGSQNGFKRDQSSQTNSKKRKSDSPKNFPRKRRGKKGNDNFEGEDEFVSSNDSDLMESIQENNAVDIKHLKKAKRKSASFMSESVSKKRICEEKSKSSGALPNCTQEDLFDDIWVEKFMVDINIPKIATSDQDSSEVAVSSEDTFQRDGEQPLVGKEDSLSPIRELIVGNAETCLPKLTPTPDLTPKRDHIVVNPLAEILRGISKDIFDDFPEFSEPEIAPAVEVESEDENPIISAIIHGSPLKDAIKKEEARSPKRKIKMRGFEEVENCDFGRENELEKRSDNNLPKSNELKKTNDFLRSLFGDEAVIIEDKTSDNEKNTSFNIRVKDVDEINELFSSQDFKSDFENLEETLSSSQRSRILSTLFDI